MNIKTTKTTENLQNTIQTIITDQNTTKSYKIKELFNFGLTTKEISNLLNIRYNFAYNVIQNYIITDSIEVITISEPSKKDIILRLTKQNKTPKEIAITLKTNLNYIYKVINEQKQTEIDKTNIK